jgi:hypothetical protein
MTSQRKIEANRRNARRSTGPKTRAGKNRSRWNAWRHGFRARFLLAPHEDLQGLLSHCMLFLKDFRPWNEESTRLVLRLARNNWRLDRAGHYEVEVLAQDIPLSKQMRKLTRLTMYESRLEHSNDQCIQRLNRMLREALRQPNPHNRQGQPSLQLVFDGVDLYLAPVNPAPQLGSFVQKTGSLPQNWRHLFKNQPFSTEFGQQHGREPP